MTTIIVGACAASVRAELSEFFQCKGNDNLVRIAIPDDIYHPFCTDYWIYYTGIIGDGRILARHNILKHLEFATHDELLDKGISIQEMLT